jgi:hypothetical protein
MEVTHLDRGSEDPRSKKADLKIPAIKELSAPARG